MWLFLKEAANTLAEAGKTADCRRKTRCRITPTTFFVTYMGLSSFDVLYSIFSLSLTSFSYPFTGADLTTDLTCDFRSNVNKASAVKILHTSRKPKASSSKRLLGGRKNASVPVDHFQCQMAACDAFE
jgi:hypothetical protein